WEGEVRRLSGAFRKYSDVYFGTVTLQVQNSNARLVSSEGATIATPSASTRMVIQAQTRASDGMELLRAEPFHAPWARRCFLAKFPDNAWKDTGRRTKPKGRHSGKK